MLFPLSPENFRPRTHLRPTNEDPAAAKYDNPGAVAEVQWCNGWRGRLLRWRLGFDSRRRQKQSRIIEMIFRHKVVG